MIPRIHFALGIALENEAEGTKIISGSQIAAPSHGDLTSIIQKIRLGALSLFDRQALALLEEVQSSYVIVDLLVQKKLDDRDFLTHIGNINWSKDGLEAYLQGGERLGPEDDLVTICQNTIKAVKAFDRFLARLVREKRLNQEEIDKVVDEFQRKIEAFNSIGVFLRIESLSRFPKLKEQLAYLHSMVRSYISGYNQSTKSSLAKLKPFGLKSCSPQAVDLFLKELESQVREGLLNPQQA